MTGEGIRLQPGPRKVRWARATAYIHEFGAGSPFMVACVGRCVSVWGILLTIVQYCPPSSFRQRRERSLTHFLSACVLRRTGRSRHGPQVLDSTARILVILPDDWEFVRQNTLSAHNAPTSSTSNPVPESPTTPRPAGLGGVASRNPFSSPSHAHKGPLQKNARSATLAAAKYSDREAAGPPRMLRQRVRSTSQYTDAPKQQACGKKFQRPLQSTCSCTPGKHRQWHLAPAVWAPTPAHCLTCGVGDLGGQHLSLEAATTTHL
ncbi:hypothetical protein B0H66DRAFT_273355 [Apodospora peruviana]|uniref:Uncharacterized protein n=1 Tax=Apodospora peruviana TaxID=516989 RepID=A0AAE0HZT3_9PEZI|nr:hypothetical protein B0H66DRAFT_273355 [Apodospora peruviana]